MEYDTKKYRQRFENMSPEEIEAIMREADEEHQRHVVAFKAGYAKGICYLCNKPFSHFSKDTPCSHWLLRRCEFKKKYFPKIYEKYSYIGIASFVRWCANEEIFMKNINDLKGAKSDKKVLSSTVKWKNIEWTFDCSKEDFAGHPGKLAYYPHYHFQMRIDGKPFINFNDFHVPFTDHDIAILKLNREQGDWFKHNFGITGSGMQDAVSVDPEMALKHITNSSEEDAIYNMRTIIEATDKKISDEQLYEMIQESKKTGRPMAAIAQEKLKDVAKVKTVISPADSIPDIASRTKHKRK